jgi:hypothetical protein
MPIVSLSMPRSPAVGPRPSMMPNEDTENFARRLAGAGAMQGEELTRFQARRAQDATRQAQLTGLDTMMQDREAQADEVANSLRASGLADVAERFRRATRNQAFNFARRGLAGGSAALEQGELARAQSEDEASQVGEQARLSALEEVLKAQAVRDRLARDVISQDPYVAMGEQFDTSGIQQQTDDAARLAEALRAQDRARRGSRMANLSSIMSIFGGAGESAGNIVGSSAGV